MPENTDKGDFLFRFKRYWAISYSLSLLPAVVEQCREPPGTTARTTRIAVNESQLGHTGIEQLTLFVINLIEKFDTSHRTLFQQNTHGQ